MSQAAPVPPAEPEVPPTRGFGAILADLFFAPSAAFADIVRKPAVLLPLALMMALNVGFTLTWLSKMDVRTFMKAQIEQSHRDMTPEQMEQVLAMQEKVFKPMAAIIGVAALPLFLFATAGVLLVVFRSVLGAEITYKQSASIVAWSFLTVGLVNTPLLFLVMFLKGDWNIEPQSALHAGPALLVEKSSVGAALYTLATSLDLFSFWTMALLAIGFGVATRRSAGSAAWGIVPLWAAVVLVKVLWAALMR